MPTPTTQVPLIEKLTALDAARQGFDAKIPFAERINTLTAQSTQALGNPVIRDNPAKRAAYDAEAKYPFTPEARTKLADLKIRGVLPGQKIDNEANIQGRYSLPGQDVYKAAHSVLPTNVAEWMSNKLSRFDSPDITIKPDIHNPETVAAHEMLHHLFESSPVSQDPKTGQAWLGAWDKVKQTDQDMGPLLSNIDQHLQEGHYDMSNAYEIATERYAYLGEMVLKYGINIIPKELQPYYHGVIDGAAEPTPEQYGVGMTPEKGFTIDMNRREAAPKSRSGESLYEKSPGGKAINYVLGRSTYNKNEGSPAPEKKPAPAAKPGKKEVSVPVVPKNQKPSEAKQVIIGTLFGEVSNRTPDKQILESRTILNTARNRAKQNGTTVLQELTKANQYQGYGGNEYKRYIAGKLRPSDKQKIKAISDALKELDTGKLVDNTGGQVHYVHVTSGPHEGSIVYMTPKEFNTYYKKRGKARDAYAASLVGG